MTASGGVCSFRLLDVAEGVTQSSALCCFVKGDKGMLLWVPRGPLEGWWRGGLPLCLFFVCLTAFHLSPSPELQDVPREPSKKTTHALWLPYLQTDGSPCSAPSQPCNLGLQEDPSGGCNWPGALWPGVTCHVWAPPCFPDEPDRPLTSPPRSSPVYVLLPLILGLEGFSRRACLSKTSITLTTHSVHRSAQPGPPSGVCASLVPYLQTRVLKHKTLWHCGHWPSTTYCDL